MPTAYLKYIQFCIFMGNLGFFSNAFFGFILVYLTLFHIKRQFGSYKYLLVNFQVLGFIFASFEFLFHTFLHTYNASLTYFSLSRPLGLSNFAMEWMMAIYTGLYSATICMLAIQFLYRYWAIFDTPKLVYFNGWNYLIWVSYYVFFGVLWAFAVGHFFAMDDFGRDYLKDEVLLRYERNITDIPVLGLIAYEGDDIRWRNVYGLSLMTMISFIQYFVIVICAQRMFVGMRTKLSVLSPMIRRLHRQFFRALVIQITAPTIILFCPVFFMIYAPFADLEISFPSCIIQSGFTVYPALDSIIMMSCVSEYGRAIKKLIQSKKEKYTFKTPEDEQTPKASTTGHTLQTSQTTKLGWNYCPTGEYASGIQIKAEDDQRGGDDTGLNAVALYCRPYPSSSEEKRTYIMSGEGSYGDWQAVKWCPPGNAIIGFALRSEGNQHGHDDVAADNFYAFCEALNGPRDSSAYGYGGDTEGWGDWTAHQFCPSGYLVCGIDTQIEDPQGGGDDTSLNNVDLDCCEGRSNDKLTTEHKTAGLESDWATVAVHEFPAYKGAGQESEWAADISKDVNQMQSVLPENRDKLLFVPRSVEAPENPKTSPESIQYHFLFQVIRFTNSQLFYDFE